MALLEARREGLCPFWVTIDREAEDLPTLSIRQRRFHSHPSPRRFAAPIVISIIPGWRGSKNFGGNTKTSKSSRVFRGIGSAKSQTIRSVAQKNPEPRPIQQTFRVPNTKVGLAGSDCANSLFYNTFDAIEQNLMYPWLPCPANAPHKVARPYQAPR